MTDRDKLCREFTELTGGHWHEPDGSNTGTCTCSKWYLACPFNPRWENTADVLRVMMERNDFDDFLIIGLQKNHWLELEEFIENYIIEPDALLKVAVEWLREEKK